MPILDWSKPPCYVFRYGAAGDGSIAGGSGTDDRDAFVSADSVGGQIVVTDNAIHRISSDLTLESALLIESGTIAPDAGVTLTLNGPLEIHSALPFAGPGVVVFGSAARPGRLANRLPDRAAGVPVRGGCQYHAFGDSYTTGTGVTAATCYPALFGSTFNTTLNNHGVGGRGVTRATLEAFLNLPKYGARRCLITCMAGFNDLHYGTSNPKTLVKIESEARAFLANAFLKTAVPADDANVTKTGAWSNATAGTWADKAQTFSGHPMFSTTNADKIAYAFTGTNVIVGYFENKNSTYTLCDFDVYIDSALVETISPNNVTDGNVGFPETYEAMTHAVLFYSNLGSGSHTIELRMKSANYLAVDYFGTLAAAGDCPSVLMAEIPHVNAAGYAGPEAGRSKTIDENGSAAIRRAVQAFAPLGFPVALVAPNDHYDYQAHIQGDDDHPDTIGHQELHEGFLSRCFPSNYSLQPSCTFKKAATQSVANTTPAAITFSSALDDFHGFRDASNTGRVYAPFAGTYRLSGTVAWASNSTGRRDADIHKNGDGTALKSICRTTAVSGAETMASFCIDVPLVEGDYVEVRASQSSGGSLDLTVECQLDVMMLR